jgi:hypothetical protein
MMEMTSESCDVVDLYPFGNALCAAHLRQATGISILHWNPGMLFWCGDGWSAVVPVEDSQFDLLVKLGPKCLVYEGENILCVFL